MISVNQNFVKEIGKAESEFDFAEQRGQLLFRCKGFGAQSRYNTVGHRGSMRLSSALRTMQRDFTPGPIVQML